MYEPKYLDKREVKYLKRKEQINKNFKWEKEDVQRLCKLNSELLNMQNVLAEKVKSAYEIFSKWKKGEMPFLHGFKVIGTIDFEKEIVKKLEELDKTTKAQREIIEKWDNISDFSRDEIESWQLVFDSLTGDFMPLSKVRLNQTKEHIWNLDFPEDEEEIEFCGYLSHFIKNNRTFSDKDLAELTIKDFEPNLEVVLNYEVSELRRFTNYYPYRGADSDFIYNMLEDRRYTLNENFEWSEANIQKMMDVNSWIWKMTAEMQDELTKLNNAFADLSKKNQEFKYYNLEGEIEYHGSKANDIASLEVQKEMTRRAAFWYWSLFCGDDRPLADPIHDDESLNWNFEVYRNHFSEEQQKVRFHYFMHILFIDDYIYSFEDLVRMKEEDFKICLEIYWYGDS